MMAIGVFFVSVADKCNLLAELSIDCIDKFPLVDWRDSVMHLPYVLDKICHSHLLAWRTRAQGGLLIVHPLYLVS